MVALGGEDKKGSQCWGRGWSAKARSSEEVALDLRPTGASYLKG